MIERLWAIAQPNKKGIVYAIGKTREDVWQFACFSLHACYHPEMVDEMKRQGYKAIKVDVVYSFDTVKVIKRQ